jgi:hypothetical protein
LPEQKVPVESGQRRKEKENGDSREKEAKKRKKVRTMVKVTRSRKVIAENRCQQENVDVKKDCWRNGI